MKAILFLSIEFLLLLMNLELFDKIKLFTTIHVYHVENIYKIVHFMQARFFISYYRDDDTK